MNTGTPGDAKASVRDFWDEASCGERLLLPSQDRRGFEQQAVERYRLEPYIPAFAGFEQWRGQRVLEIGVGLGADHQRFVEAGARTSGIDLTPRAIDMTRRRLDAFDLASDLAVGDAEKLPFAADEFDLVYSWGVIHHSPDTPRVVAQILRVLKPGGRARVMIYSKWSLIGLMLWTRYALLRGRPFTSLRTIYAQHLESPGTKAYSVAEARALFSAFEDVRVSTVLSHGDLLSSGAGQRHAGPALDLARRIWPRWLITRLLKGRGLFMMIDARKPSR
jgi:SAM-dependent methyltransferase